MASGIGQTVRFIDSFVGFVGRSQFTSKIEDPKDVGDLVTDVQRFQSPVVWWGPKPRNKLNLPPWRPNKLQMMVRRRDFRRIEVVRIARESTGFKRLTNVIIVSLAHRRFAMTTLVSRRRQRKSLIEAVIR
ncbi:MAG: hypothetical protein CMJ80_10200 [Planctomycetaceae bacterium]|nr:hypothetical protein [Planctomycetaceae bacterium]